MKIQQVNEMIQAYKSYNTYMDKEQDIPMLMRAAIAFVAMPLIIFMISGKTHFEFMITALSFSVMSLTIREFLKSFLYKIKIETKEINEQVLKFLIENEVEIIQLMDRNVKSGNIYFAELKLSFINKDYDKVVTCLNLLIKNSIEESIEEKYTIEEQLKISQYDIDMSLKKEKEKEINYSYIL